MLLYSCLLTLSVPPRVNATQFYIRQYISIIKACGALCRDEHLKSPKSSGAVAANPPTQFSTSPLDRALDPAHFDARRLPAPTCTRCRVIILDTAQAATK